MSWSVAAVGKASAVRKSIADQFTRNPCAEPEETVRQNAAKVLDAAVAAQDDSQPVEVTASGSQAFRDYSAKTGLSNQLTMSVRPLCGEFKVQKLVKPKNACPRCGSVQVITLWERWDIKDRFKDERVKAGRRVGESCHEQA